MKDLEKKIIEQYNHDKVSLPDFDEVWISIENKRRGKKMRTMKVFVAVAAAAVISFGGIKAGPYFADASESLVSKIFGETQVKEVDSYAGPKEIQKLEESLQNAKNKLTKEEYEEYSSSLNELITYVNKMTVIENGVRTQEIERLSKEEQAKLNILDQTIKKYTQKIDGSASEQLKAAKKSASYPINELGYIPEGYQLSKVYVNESEKGEPIVRREYMNGELVLTTIQSGMLKNNEDDFTLRPSKTLETFKEKGLTIQYGTNEGSSFGQMKAIVYKEDGTPHYQVYVSASNMKLSDMKQIVINLTN